MKVYDIIYRGDGITSYNIISEHIITINLYEGKINVFGKIDLTHCGYWCDVPLKTGLFRMLVNLDKTGYKDRYYIMYCDIVRNFIRVQKLKELNENI